MHWHISARRRSASFNERAHAVTQHIQIKFDEHTNLSVRWNGASCSLLLASPHSIAIFSRFVSRNLSNGSNPPPHSAFDGWNEDIYLRIGWHTKKLILKRKKDLSLTVFFCIEWNRRETDVIDLLPEWSRWNRAIESLRERNEGLSLRCRSKITSPLIEDKDITPVVHTTHNTRNPRAMRCASFCISFDYPELNSSVINHGATENSRRHPVPRQKTLKAE